VKIQKSIQITQHSTHEIIKEIKLRNLVNMAISLQARMKNNVHGNINIEGNIGLGTLIRNDAKK
jgi:hypothetical protein